MTEHRCAVFSGGALTRMMMDFDSRLPGSTGEHELQRILGTEERARKFYADQVLDRVNDKMRAFIARQEMMFVATADKKGECDCSFRAGPPGFIRVLDERTLAYPEYRGNGVMASLGNLVENPNIGLLMIDFFEDLVGLHVNGRALLVEHEEFLRQYPGVWQDDVPGRRPRVWVRLHVEEAYIHCSKHIPRLAKVPRHRAWGTDDVKRKGGDYFAAKGLPRPWTDACSLE